MNGMDAVELLKNSRETNAEEWLKQTSIISYGVVVEAIGGSYAKVQKIVRTGVAKSYVIVPIISVGSAMSESAAAPVKGDLVLLLFLDRYNRNMFDLPAARAKAQKGDWGIYDSDATGYNRFSGVGLLMAPFRGMADTVMRHSQDEAGTPNVSLTSRAQWQAVFGREMNILFDALPGDGEMVDRLIRLTFSQNSPLLAEHWAAVTRLHGFTVKSDLSLETVVAPVVERYSTMAPITKDIQGTQTIKIGKGTNPAGNPSGSPVDTHAPVTVEMGADADMQILSKSGLILHFDTGVEILADSTHKVKLGNAAHTLGPLIDALVDALTTTPLVAVTGAAGAPSPINPAIVTALNAFKTNWDATFS